MEAISTMVQRRMHFATVLGARVLRLGYLPPLLCHISGLRSMHKHPSTVSRYVSAYVRVSTQTGYYLFEIEVARLRLRLVRLRLPSGR